MSTTTKQQIVGALRNLGVSQGTILLVHSSLSSMGRVDGGANTVIDALLEALGPDGTLLMPTHPARDGHTFDPEFFQRIATKKNWGAGGRGIALIYALAEHIIHGDYQSLEALTRYLYFANWQQLLTFMYQQLDLAPQPA